MELSEHMRWRPSLFFFFFLYARADGTARWHTTGGKPRGERKKKKRRKLGHRRGALPAFLEAAQRHDEHSHTATP